MNPFIEKISVKSYALWSLVAIIFWALAGLTIDITKNTSHSDLGHSLGPALAVGGSIIAILAIVRRLQDAGYSGWWALLGFVPFVGLIMWLLLFFMPTKR